MSETIFSKIISGEIPSFKIYKNNNANTSLKITKVQKAQTTPNLKNPTQKN